jgi:rubredoxin
VTQRIVAKPAAVDAMGDLAVSFARPPRPGAAVRGDYRCAECGYGVRVRRQLLRCPMCGATAWEKAPGRSWSRRFDVAERASSEGSR